MSEEDDLRAEARRLRNNLMRMEADRDDLLVKNEQLAQTVRELRAERFKVQALAAKWSRSMLGTKRAASVELRAEMKEGAL